MSWQGMDGEEDMRQHAINAAEGANKAGMVTERHNLLLLPANPPLMLIEGSVVK